MSRPRKLTDDQVKHIRNLFAAQAPVRKIAEKFHISISHVYRLVKGVKQEAS